MPPIALGIPVAAPDVQPDTPVQFGRHADEAGAHSVWLIDRVPFQNHEALISLAAIAGATTRVRLGTSVLLGTIRPPLLLAKMAATLDQVSNGRLILGMGVGRREEDFAAAGASFAMRGPRLAEEIRLLRQAWSGQPIEHHERHYQYSTAPVGPRPLQAHLPIYLGGTAETALRRIARLADGYVGSSAGGVSGFRQRVQAIKQFAEEAGRDPSSLTMVGVVYGCVDPSRERAYALARRYVEHYYPGENVRDLDNNYFLGPASEGERLTEAFVNAGADIVCLSSITANPSNLDHLVDQLLPRVLG